MKPAGPAELENIRGLGGLTVKAGLGALPEVRPGVSEKIPRRANLGGLHPERLEWAALCTLLTKCPMGEYYGNPRLNPVTAVRFDARKRRVESDHEVCRRVVFRGLSLRDYWQRNVGSLRSRVIDGLVRGSDLGRCAEGFTCIRISVKLREMAAGNIHPYAMPS